jgi:hypothetical protein
MAGGDDALASSASASLLDAEDDDLDMESEPAAPTRQQSQEAVLSGKSARVLLGSVAGAPAVLPAFSPTAAPS